MAHQRLLTHVLIPVMLLGCYVVLSLLPVLLAGSQQVAPRPWRDDLASGLAMTGFVMLLAEFFLSGRFRTLSAHMGMDRIMRFHQIMAYVIIGFLLAHPYLYSLPMGTPAVEAAQRPRDWLHLPLLPGLSGLLAWLLLGILVFAAAARDALPVRYETWRLSHGLGAVVIALLGLHHSLDAGRYSQDSWLAAFWVLAVAAALGSLIHVHLVIPLRQRRWPMRISRVARLADRTWNVELEPDAGAGHSGKPFRFRAGQFAWLKLHHPLFRITEHPFSISTAPGDWPRLGFTIKEAGDFTAAVSSLAVGTRAYIDGPYGHFTLDPDETRPLVLLAGGVGMAPMIALLRELRTQRSSRPLVLIQGNRAAEQRLFTDELRAMQAELKLDVHDVLAEPPDDWTGPRGILDRRLLEQLLPPERFQDAVFYVCGPPAMIDSVEEILRSGLGVPSARIRSERFRHTHGAHHGRAASVPRAAAGVVLAMAAGLLWFVLR